MSCETPLGQGLWKCVPGLLQTLPQAPHHHHHFNRGRVSSGPSTALQTAAMLSPLGLPSESSDRGPLWGPAIHIPVSKFTGNGSKRGVKMENKFCIYSPKVKKK